MVAVAAPGVVDAAMEMVAAPVVDFSEEREREKADVEMQVATVVGVAAMVVTSGSESQSARNLLLSPRVQL